MVDLRPQVSEKAYAMSIKGFYVFKVPMSANKHQIKDEVEKRFGVTVEEVNTLINGGKVTRTIALKKQSRVRMSDTKKQDVKKAIVKLKKGDVINIAAFENVTNDNAPVGGEK